MKFRHIAALLMLGALWGLSYTFMALGASQFGPWALAGVRAAGAACLLSPFLATPAGRAAVRGHWRAIAFVGITGSALPFVLFNYAALSIHAGLSSVFSAGATLFTALLATLWLGEVLPARRWLGLLIGFLGVFGLAFAKVRTSFAIGSAAEALAVAACLAATVLYGVASTSTRRFLGEVPPLVVAAGSQLASALALMPLAAWQWPQAMPSPGAWLSAGALAVLCTALAYILFFSLIARLGPSRTMTVTFVIPVFGLLWAFVLLGEIPSAAMVVGCAVILLGTALALGRAPVPGRSLRDALSLGEGARRPV